MTARALAILLVLAGCASAEPAGPRLRVRHGPTFRATPMRIVALPPTCGWLSAPTAQPQPDGTWVVMPMGTCEYEGVAEQVRTELEFRGFAVLDSERLNAESATRREERRTYGPDEGTQPHSTTTTVEVTGLDERSPVIPLVTSTRDNCLGSECPQFRDCHVVRARREAMAADLVVVNHHLFFADLTLRDSGVAELLPSADVTIVDRSVARLRELSAQFGSALQTAY